jgi:hypothetical protein
MEVNIIRCFLVGEWSLHSPVLLRAPDLRFFCCAIWAPLSCFSTGSLLPIESVQYLDSFSREQGPMQSWRSLSVGLEVRMPELRERISPLPQKTIVVK